MQLTTYRDSCFLKLHFTRLAFGIDCMLLKNILKLICIQVKSSALFSANIVAYCAAPNHNNSFLIHLMFSFYCIYYIYCIYAYLFISIDRTHLHSDP